LERRFQPVWVSEPTVEQTISILRGLVPRYEAHHAVRIRDSALVAAAQLSHRYITDRFLPDKAIDLIDEAAAKLRMELDGVPADLYTLQRRIEQFRIDEAILRRETDAESQARLAKLVHERMQLEATAAATEARWRDERLAIEEVDRLRAQLARSSDEEAVIDLEHGSRRKQLLAGLQKAEDQLRAVRAEGSLLRDEVDDQDVAAVVARWTGIPVSKLLESERQKLLHMEERLHQRVIGQDEAIRAVSNAIRRARAGLQDPKRPIGSFLFLGPTGVGKTELTRALAEFLFDSEHAMIRLDMSEYMEKHTVSRLTGAPPGYVGYEEGGQLTEAVRRKPFAVVLFDEIEKAHSDVFNLLLQILEDGRLTDGQGRTVDFKNTVIVMTGNIGTRFDDDPNEPLEAKRERVFEALRHYFRPEFLNRVDEILVFHSLDQNHLKQIVDIQIRALSERLAEQRLGLELTDAAREYLAAAGFDPTYGARPLKRTIQRRVIDALAGPVLEGKFQPGDVIRIDCVDGELIFERRPAAPIEPAEKPRSRRKTPAARAS
jgi:ATP-dependent Clp protease ATP-binding subunit ClpB